MRNLKKFLALVLATLMVVSAAATVSAYAVFDDVEDDNQYAEAIGKLVEYDITNGIGDGLFGVDNDVERYQMALFMARALNPNETDWQSGMAIFDDVEEWYGAIAYAYTKGIVTGIGNNLFAPHNGIRYQDALIMALRALGYTVDVSGDPYWLAAYTQAAELGLTDNVAVTKGDKVLTRAETAQVICNMLSAKPADGGATIEEKNFGVIGTDNFTTFVITATEKQAYSDSAKAAEAGFVGVQELKNGIPAGDIKYIEVEKLGLTAENVDDHFGYTFDFVNYDAKTGEYDKIVPGLEPVVAYNDSISGKDNAANKFKFDGVTYYAVDAVSGAALKNEIVIFNGGEKGVSPKMLLTNKDGDIVNYNGAILATFAYETATGAKYYAYQDVTTGTTKVISESVALDKFGVAVDNDSYIEYKTLSVSALTGNYEIKFFDDDRNGNYDRAIVTDVYVSAYNGKDSDGTESFGPMSNDKGVSYVDNATKEKVTLTKGQVFTYTYNKQTAVVSVIDIIDVSVGTLTRVNTTKNNGDNSYNVTLTIDGVQYVLGNAVREGKGLTGATIYNKVAATSDGGKYDKVKSDAKLNYYYDTLALSDLAVGSRISYYALPNKTIITAKTYPVDQVFDYAVLKDITAYDDENVYADLYINGKLTNDVAISVVDGQVFAELNVFQRARLLADNLYFASGNVFRAVKLADGSYQLSEALDATEATSRTKFGLYTMPYDQKLTFDDGIMDIGTNGVLPSGQRDVFIRTKDTTVFYFLKRNTAGKITAISTYVGAPDNSVIDCQGGDIKIYADKIGYGSNGYNGVANCVIVYYEDSTRISGFGVANVEYNTAYIFGSGAVSAYDYASASDLGLTDPQYAGKYYYAYNVTAINMANGAKITTVYRDSALTADKFYKLSSDNVVIGETTVETAVLSKNDFVQNRYYTIGVNGAVVDTADKISTVKLTKSSGYDVKTDKPGDVLGTSYMTVKYIEDYADGSFVGVAFAPTAPAGQVKILTNAKWNKNISGGVASEVKAANFSYEIKDGKVVGTFILTDANFDYWNKEITANKISFGEATYTVDDVMKKGSTAETPVRATCTVENGLLKVTISKIPANANDTSTVFAAGEYTAKIVVNNDTIEFGFIVG